MSKRKQKAEGNTLEEIGRLKSHSAMLGQIAAIVAEYCHGEMTTLEGVETLAKEKKAETALANHYCRRLVDAKKEGYLPDEFKF